MQEAKRKMENYSKASMIALGLLAFAILATGLASATTTLSIGDVSLGQSETEVVPILLDDVTTYGTATIELHYNGSVVNVESVSNGNIPGTSLTPNINNTAGYTRMLIYTSLYPGPSGDFVFVNVTLRAVGAELATSPLDLYIEEFADTDGQPISVTPDNGTFTILDATSPEILAAYAQPTRIANDGSSMSELYVEATDASGIDNVTLNLSSVGGDLTEMTPLIDNNTWRYNLTLSSVTPGTYYLPVNVTDIYGNYNNSASIELEVVEPVIISIDNASAASGNLTTTKIEIENVTNFGTCTINLSYNGSVVSVESVSNGNISNSSLTPIVDNTNGTTTLIVVSSDIPGPSGNFIYVNITLNATGSSGEKSSMNLTIEELLDSDGEYIPSKAINGTFSVGVKGDVSGDGEVTGVDAMFIAQYVAGTRPASGLDLANGDVSGDGEVTGVDAMFIAQYVAGTRPNL